MKLVYVFDCTESAGYLVRVPEFIARLIVRHSSRTLDYWSTPQGARI